MNKEDKNKISNKFLNAMLDKPKDPKTIEKLKNQWINAIVKKGTEKK